MLCRVDLVRTDVSEEPRASIIRVTRIGELGTTLALTSNRRTIRRNALCIIVTRLREVLRSSVTWFITKETRRNIQEDAIHHSHRRENLKSYIVIVCFLWSRNCLGVK
jgi:hypothetical protein